MYKLLFLYKLMSRNFLFTILNKNFGQLVHESTRILYRVPLILPLVSSYISLPLEQNILTI